MSDVLDTYYFLKYFLDKWLPYHIIDDILDYMELTDNIGNIKNILDKCGILEYEDMVGKLNKYKKSTENLAAHVSIDKCDICKSLNHEDDIRTCYAPDCYLRICDDCVEDVYFGDEPRDFHECSKDSCYEFICDTCYEHGYTICSEH